jgi:hypothetical protein
MAAPTTERTPTSVQPARAPSSWSSHLQEFALAAALIALDLLPLYTSLLLGAANTAGDVSHVALPFSFLVVASAISALVGRALRRLPLALTALAGILVGGALWLIAIAISPATYADVPGGLWSGNWLTVFLADLAAGSSRINQFIALGVLVLVLVWRGLAHGRNAPSLDSVLTLFKISLGVLIFAAILIAGLGPRDRLAVSAALTLMLPLDIFAGLLASVLARAALNREELRGADARTAGSERWLGMAVALSGGVVLIALLISAIVSFGSFSAAVAQLSPLGEAIGVVVGWLIYGIARLLFFLFGPVISGLQSVIGHAPRRAPTPTPAPTQLPPSQSAPPPNLIPDLWIHIAQIALGILLVLFVLLVAILILRLMSKRRRERGDGVDEEREALDGASLLQAQMRDLLGRLGRRRATEPEEALPAGGVRALYRELLRAAATRGIGRRSPETPDEYAGRLSAALRGDTSPSDVATLSEAYDEARYGEREAGEGERRTLREQARRVLQALKQRTSLN